MFLGRFCIFPRRGEVGNGYGRFDGGRPGVYKNPALYSGGAVAQLGARLDGIEEVVGSNPIGSTRICLLVIDRA
jgi:hypothetical protein